MTPSLLCIQVQPVSVEGTGFFVDPFPWMSETIDLGKEKNFFETHVTEYQSASALQWD